MPPTLQRLVLVGGGHAHVEVLRRWAREPVAGVELILLAGELQPAYSGMIPGVIAGHYPVTAAQVEIPPLAAAARAVLLHDQATHLDPLRKCLVRRRGGAVPYDLVSLDVGSTPATALVPGAAEWSLPVKPISQLLTGLRMIESRMKAGAGPFRIVMVGAGVAGTEVLLALHHRWHENPGLEWTLLGADPEPLAGFPGAVRRRIRRIFAERQIRYEGNSRVMEVTDGELRTSRHHDHPFDALFWAVGAAPPAWLAATGLATDAEGFVAVNEFLQSTSHPAVFGAGDCVTMIHSPRPKAGVFAVRQAPFLFENLCRALRDQPLLAFRPQRQFLTLIATGGRHAIARRGAFSLAGKWVWRWKERIDRRWLERYRLPARR